MNLPIHSEYFDTLAIRSGQRRSHEGEHNDPIFMTSSFVFNNAAQAADRFSEREIGNVYSRFTNPTVRTFEERLAALEHGQYCSATASGMAAVLLACMTILQTGDHIIASHALFGSSISLFNNILSRFGITTTYAPMDSLEQWEEAVTPVTRMFFVESPSNPLSEVIDLKQLSALAHRHNAYLVVDNVACTPALQQPLRLGADVVVHSATKYIDGQGRAMGGALVTNDTDLGVKFFRFNRTAGPTMSPFNAWLFLNGLETLSLRMRAHSKQALALAHWLEAHPAVAQVYYSGLESNLSYRIASYQQSAFGGVLAFDVKGGREQAWAVIDATKLISITANLGDVKTTITHPASTTHTRITAADRQRMGVKESLIRVATGLEHLDDIKTDINRGLSKCKE